MMLVDGGLYRFTPVPAFGTALTYLAGILRDDFGGASPFTTPASTEAG